jgi:putative aminopeptidase FrvX
MKLLKQLTEIRSASGDEGLMKDFLIQYINENKAKWKVQPELFYEDDFQDTLILVFGKPRTAIYAHTDSIGFTVGYNNNLVQTV